MRGWIILVWDSATVGTGTIAVASVKLRGRFPFASDPPGVLQHVSTGIGLGFGLSIPRPTSRPVSRLIASPTSLSVHSPNPGWTSQVNPTPGRLQYVSKLKGHEKHRRVGKPWGVQRIGECRHLESCENCIGVMGTLRGWGHER